MSGELKHFSCTFQIHLLKSSNVLDNVLVHFICGFEHTTRCMICVRVCVGVYADEIWCDIWYSISLSSHQIPTCILNHRLNLWNSWKYHPKISQCESHHNRMENSLNSTPGALFACQHLTIAIAFCVIVWMFVQRKLVLHHHQWMFIILEEF